MVSCSLDYLLGFRKIIKNKNRIVKPIELINGELEQFRTNLERLP